MKIVLISPKGPLYRHRGGIFKKILRYAPLTLTTLASLVPPELEAEIRLHRRRHRRTSIWTLEADLVGMTVITGTRAAGLRAGGPFPRARHPGGAGRPARDADPGRRAAPRRRRRRRLRGGDLAAAAARLRRRPACAALRPGARPGPRGPAASRAATCSTKRRLPHQHTSSRRRAAASTAATSASCPPPGGEAVPEAGRGGGRGHPPARGAQAHLHRPQPDRRHGLRRRACSRR